MNRICQGQRLRRIANDQLPIADGATLPQLLGYWLFRIGHSAKRWAR